MDDQHNEAQIAAEKREQAISLATAFLAASPTQIAEIPNVIGSIAKAVDSLYTPHEVEVVVAPRAEPAVDIEASITDDKLICLEDGRSFKSLKRHLRSKFDMSPEQYRAKWGLPADYPMVAPNYAKARSELAKQMGLGLGGRKPAGRRAAAAPRAARGGRSTAAKSSDAGSADAAAGTSTDIRFPEGISSIGDTIKPDGLICLEDGEITKNLLRHLKTLGITPADYRAKWGLSDEYPMTLNETKDFDFDKVKLERE